MPDQRYQPPPHPYQEWKVLSARSGKTVPNKNGPGELTNFYIDFEGVEDGWCNSDGAYWRRMSGNEPSIGDSFWGELSVGEHGYRFDWDNTKATSSAEKPSQPSSPAFRAAAGQPPTGESQDARQASIVRQHSQEMAIRFLAAAMFRGPEPNPEFTPEWLDLNLLPIVDFFQADAGGQSRSQVSKPDDGSDLPF